MTRNETSGRDVSKVSRRGLLTLGATLAGVSGLGAFSGTASAHGLTAFRDAFIGNDGDKTGLGSKGWLFFAKDTGTVYYHTGSSWENIPLGGQLADSDGDGLLEAPNHGGIDVGTVETDEIHLGADTDGDGSEWRFDTDSSDTARMYSWDGSAATEYFRLNEGGPVEVKNSLLTASSGLSVDGPAYDDSSFTVRPDGSHGVTIKGESTSLLRAIDSSTTNLVFEVLQGGRVEIPNGGLYMNGNDINEVGTLNASTKNFVQDIGGGKEAVYTAQESPDVRAVVESSVEVGPDGATVSLPDHFDAVSSDDAPDVTVQATPDELTQVACTSRSTTELEFEAAKPCKVDYRVTARREGYEDKQIVRNTRTNQTSTDQETILEPES